MGFRYEHSSSPHEICYKMGKYCNQINILPKKLKKNIYSYSKPKSLIYSVYLSIYCTFTLGRHLYLIRSSAKVKSFLFGW